MKQLICGSLLACLVLVLVAGAAAANDTEKEAFSFKHKALQKWNIVLPGEKFTPVAGGINVKHAGGDSFPAELQGTALAVDTNGDGKVDKKAKGTGGHFVLKGKTADGAKFKYAVRLQNSGGWKYAAGGVMQGKVKGIPVRLIDQNNNGSYNDYGADAMIVGKGNAASFLSKVVNLGGELYEFEVSEDGLSASIAPFEGETGTLNLRKGFKSKGGKLEAAVMSAEGGDYSFNLASFKKGMKVPVGEYELQFGFVTKGAERVKIRQGSMKPIVVTAGESADVTWGGPLRAEFTYTRADGVLKIAPTDLHFFGKNGEEYFDWFPDGAPPKFIVKDAKSNRELGTLRFGGC